MLHIFVAPEKAPRMIRRFTRERALRPVRNRLRFSLLRRRLEPGTRFLDRPPAEAIAVLAPHPDDDVIGCGGSLCKHRRAGEDVTVIYLTDGGRGNDWTAGPSPELARTRRREAEEAADLLGIRKLVFLDFPDGELAPGRVTTNRIYQALEVSGARCVFLPSPLDDHPDHQAANRILASLIPRLDRNTSVYAYEVWTPLEPNRLVDITEAVAVKEAAIRRHASQTRLVDYAAATLGLNRFRSLSVTAGRGFCEAFFAAEAETYRRLVKEILGI